VFGDVQRAKRGKQRGRPMPRECGLGGCKTRAMNKNKVKHVNASTKMGRKREKSPMSWESQTGGDEKMKRCKDVGGSFVRLAEAWWGKSTGKKRTFQTAQFETKMGCGVEKGTKVEVHFQLGGERKTR